MRQVQDRQRHDGEEGFMLLVAVVLIFLVLLALSVAAPKVAQALRRDREVEAIHRGNEYVRAIQLYYRKFGRYPGNMDQLEKSNNIRFLRQKYEDPMTGKPDWRLIHVGEAKTTVKGFFGQPLAGLPGGGGTGGLGAASSMVSGQPTQTVGGTASGSSRLSSSGSFSLGPGIGSSSGPGGSSIGGTTGGSSTTSGPGGTSTSPGGTSTVSSGAGSSSSGSGFGGGTGSQSATSFSGGGAPIVGVGSSKSGTSITDLNEQTAYEKWEFLYDPRIEQMKAKAALLGGPASGGSGSSGMGSGPIGTPIGAPAGGSTSPTSPSSPTSPTSPSPPPTTPQ
jgi:type II secretory pathway pseudopilin PulG